MKIRTDFVTNSSSSCFVAYRLRDSEFCKYLTEQMEKNGFSINTEKMYHDKIILEGSSLDARINVGDETLFYTENTCTYCRNEYRSDVDNTYRMFLDEMGKLIPFEKVDDPEKLYDAFLSDLENHRLKCTFTEAMTDDNDSLESCFIHDDEEFDEYDRKL